MSPKKTNGRVVAIVRPRVPDLATTAMEERLTVKEVIKAANEHQFLGLAGEDGVSILDPKTRRVIAKRTPDDIEVDWLTLQDVMDTTRGDNG